MEQSSVISCLSRNRMNVRVFDVCVCVSMYLCVCVCLCIGVCVCLCVCLTYAGVFTYVCVL